MKEPLTPHPYGAGTLPPAPASPPASDPDEDLQVRIDARVFALKFELRTEREDSARERRVLQRIIDELKREHDEERAENAKIILTLRKRVEYLEQGPLLNRLHPQCQTQPTPEENQETSCQKKQN